MSYMAAFGSVEVSQQGEALGRVPVCFLPVPLSSYTGVGGGGQKSKDNDLDCLGFVIPPYFWFEKRNRNLG